MIDKKLLERTIMKWSVISYIVFLAIFSFSELITFQLGEKSEFNGYIFGFSIFISIILFLRGVLFDLLVPNPETELPKEQSRSSTDV